MHQTICGETPKISRVYKKKEIELFFKEEAIKYINFKNKRCIYGNKIYIDSPAINYLNENVNVDSKTLARIVINTGNIAVCVVKLNRIFRFFNIRFGLLAKPDSIDVDEWFR